MSFIILAEQTVDPAAPSSGKAIMYFMDTGRIRLEQSDGTVHEFQLDNASTDVDFNYSLGKTAADSAHDFPYTTADEIVKLGADSMWQADLTGGDQWSSIDLGSALRIDKIVVKHYTGPFDSNADYATSEFKIQWSNDNSSWTDYNHITGNTDAISTFDGVGLSHRYWRILVIIGESDTSPGLARIKRLELIQTNQATILVDGDGNSYVVMPDSSKHYVSNINYVELFGLGSFSDVPTPPTGSARLAINSDGITLYVKDANGDGHTLVYRGVGDFVQISPVTVTSNSETTLVGSGSNTLGYGQLFIAGSVLRQALRGILSTDGATPGNLTYNIYLGSTLLASTGAIALPTSLTTALFVVDVDTTILTVGLSGTLKTFGSLDIFSGGARLSYPIFNQSGISTAITMDVTSGANLNHKVLFSIGGVNSISNEQMVVQLLNQ